MTLTPEERAFLVNVLQTITVKAHDPDAPATCARVQGLIAKLTAEAPA